MKIHNTLTRKVEDFLPIKPGEVTLYTCGPTVYDYAQLGNLRSFVFDDTLRRTLQANGFEVKHVMNITDVGHLVSDADDGQDKLEKGAQREGKTVWEVADFYIKVFEADMKELNVLPPNAYHGRHQPYARATDFIDEQLNIIKILLDKQYAYITEQAIYFEVSKLGDYGKLSGQKLSEKETGARPDVIVDDNKHHPQDFGLWFFKIGRFAGHSMSWPSPWGEGFPGWHLECSAIIHATLGEPLDMHTGGIDHIGTHHTNEIAQTEAAFGAKLANYWVHNEFLLVEGERMGKSLGNFFTLKDVIQKSYEPLALRLLFLQAHYRSQLNFTWRSLDAAQVFLKSLQAFADLQHQAPADRNEQAAKLYNSALAKMKSALSDDLNSAQALAVLSDLASGTEENGVDRLSLQVFLEEIDRLVGLNLSKRPNITPQISELIGEREAARQSKDWAESDRLRQKLLDNGLEINDTPAGPIWRRV